MSRPKTIADFPTIANSALMNVPRPWYNNGSYVCNIDLSKFEQVKGVTNLSAEPIVARHDATIGTSALDPLPDPGQIGKPSALGYAINKISYVDPKLKLDLV
jgi:hypothetical protein